MAWMTGTWSSDTGCGNEALRCGALQTQETETFPHDRHRKRKLFPSWPPLSAAAHTSSRFLLHFPKEEKIARCEWHVPYHQALLSHLLPFCLHTRPLCAREWEMVAMSSALDKTFTPLGRALCCCWLPSPLGWEDRTIYHSMVLLLSLLILFISTQKIWLTSAVLLNLTPYQCVRQDFLELCKA